MNPTARPVFAALLVLALVGCAGNPASPSASVSALPRAAGRGATTAHSQQLVYVSSQYGSVGGAVNVYAAHGQSKGPIATITDGISLPAGLAVDANGNLYVANSGNNTVTVYPPGQGTPSVTYSQGIATPMSVAVGGDGTLYVANETGSSSGTGSVTEYPAGSTKPNLTISVPNEYAFSVAVDSSNALYVSWFSLSSYIMAIYKYSSEGSSAGKNLNLELPGYIFPAYAIAFDNRGDLIVPVESLTHYSPKYIAVFPPNSTRPKHRIREGGLIDVVSGIAFPAKDSNVFYVSAENDHDWMKLTYPKGVPRDVVNVSGPTGLALSP